MRQFNRILVAMDFSQQDESLLRYASGWCKNFGAEKIYFVNVQKSLEIPEIFKSYLKESDKPLDEKLRDELEGRVQNFFPDYINYDYEIDVLEGNARDQLTHWVKVKKVDLLMTGRKAEAHGRGILPQQLLRNCNRSVIFIPDGKPFSLKTIGVPVKLGMQEDIQLKLAMDWVEEGGKLVIQHFYSIPSSYNHLITTTGMLLEGMKESAENELNTLIENYRSGTKHFEIKQILKSIVEYNLSEAIEKVSADEGCDMIVMLSGSKSKLQTFLIGSETEAMVKRNHDMALLVLK